MSKTKIIKVVKELRCALTDEELLARGQALARALEQMQKREADGKAFAANVKSDIEQYKKEGLRLTSHIAEKSEWRPVECNEIHDFAEGTVTMVRLDTGELISERRMWDEERQDELHLDEDDSADPPADDALSGDAEAPADDEGIPV